MASNGEIAIRLFGALEAVDLDVIDDLIAPEVVDHSPMMGERSFEPDTLKHVAAAFKAGFPDVRLTLEHVLTDGDLVVVVERAQGTHLGEFKGHAPSGEKMEVRAAHVLRIADGRVVEHWAVRDLSGLGSLSAAAMESA
jgi:predicted ester cyclase